MREREFFAVTGDIERSREVCDRDELYHQIEEAIGYVNRKLEPFLAVPFSITVGDEFQGLLKQGIAAILATQVFACKLFPFRARFGIGVGRVDTPLAERTALMDGECLRRSRRAIEAAKQSARRRSGEALLSSRESPHMGFPTRFAVVCGDEEREKFINALLFVVSRIQEDWRGLHFRRYLMMVEATLQGKGFSLSEMAKAEGISGPALRKSIRQKLLDVAWLCVMTAGIAIDQERKPE